MLNGTETIHNIANQDCDIRFSLFFFLSHETEFQESLCKCISTRLILIQNYRQKHSQRPQREGQIFCLLDTNGFESWNKVL